MREESKSPIDRQVKRNGEVYYREVNFMLEFIAMTLFWSAVWVLLLVAFIIWLTMKGGSGGCGTGSA